MDYAISFTDKEITPWAGLGFLRSMMDKLGFSQKISSMSFIPQPNSNRGYSPETIIEAFMVSVWCGANRFLHTEVTRHDKALSNMFGWDRVPGNESSSVDIWRSYRQRGDSENRIKEIKEDFGFDSFNLKDFYATEAALTTAVMGYNLMAMFRMFVLNSRVQHKLSTLRYKTFAIGAYFQKSNGRYILKIALARQRRKWFLGLWNESNSVKSPFVFSNA